MGATVVTTDLATRLLENVLAVPRKEATSMVLCAKHPARCSNTSQTGLAPWTNGAGRHARRTSCSQESSVMVLVMHCIILLMASVLARVKVTLLTKSHSVSSTATMRIGGRNSTLLVASSAARTTLLPGSSGVTATRSTAWKWPSAAKCNVVCGTSASGSTSRVHSLTGTANLRME